MSLNAHRRKITALKYELYEYVHACIHIFQMHIFMYFNRYQLCDKIAGFMLSSTYFNTYTSMDTHTKQPVCTHCDEDLNIFIHFL